MRVGVVDVGANTIRLLVAARDGSGLRTLHTARAEVGLGAHIEKAGVIPERKLKQAHDAAAAQVADARQRGCALVEIVVTSPGRQAENASELVTALTDIDGANVRVLTAEEEGALAYRGALAGIEDLPESVAVCDVGGGSTQVVIGTRLAGPAWQQSIDLGSLRLTRRVLEHDPPAADEIERARAVVEALVGQLAPPFPQAAYATGGSARAVAKLVGPQLAAPELAVALRIVSERPSRRIVKTFGVSQRRAQTLVAGTLLLTAVQQLLAVPLQVARGGVRDGLALKLLNQAAIAA